MSALKRGASVTVVNPNSSQQVSQAIRASIEALKLPVPVDVSTVGDAPEVIESAEDKARAEPLLLEHVGHDRLIPSLMVIACHGDPGLENLRKKFGDIPVMGIGETSLLAAAAVGGQFGVITPVNALIEPKEQQILRYGLSQRCVGVISSNTGVMHPVSDPEDFQPYVESAWELVEQGARAVVLGCAALTLMSQEIEARVPVPIIDSVRVTVTLGASLLTRIEETGEAMIK